MKNLLRRLQHWSTWHWAPRYTLFQLCRTFAFARFYWGHPDGDWSTIAKVLQYQIRKTRESIAESNISSNTNKICKQMALTEHILQRLIDEQWWEDAKRRYPNYKINLEERMKWVKEEDRIAVRDYRLLGKMLARYLRYWWD